MTKIYKRFHLLDKPTRVEVVVEVGVGLWQKLVIIFEKHNREFAGNRYRYFFFLFYSPAAITRLRELVNMAFNGRIVYLIYVGAVLCKAKRSGISICIWQILKLVSVNSYQFEENWTNFYSFMISRSAVNMNNLISEIIIKIWSSQ